VKSIAAVILMFGVVAVPDASAAEAMSAGDLRQLCSGTDHVSVNVCRVFILGVTEGIALGMRIAERKTRTGAACVPSDVSAEALGDTVKKKLAADLSASPAAASLDAAGYIGTLLARAYPCSRAQH